MSMSNGDSALQGQVGTIVTETLGLLQQNRNEEALLKIDRALALGIPIKDLHFVAGICKLRNGRGAEAFTELREEVRLFPDNQAAVELLAQLQPTLDRANVQSQMVSTINDQLRAGQLREALQSLDQLCNGKTVPAGMHWVRAQCLNQLGRHEEALESLRRELEINPTNHDAYREFHSLSDKLGRRPIPLLHAEQRSYQSTIPAPALQSIQSATHRFTYRGVPLIKNPFDYAIYPMLLWNVKPRTIIEVGSKDGGSALWMADLLNNFGVDGHIYSIDIVKVAKVSHPRITFMEGDGRRLEQVLTESFLAKLPRPWLIIEDADHSYETSSAVLKFFHPRVQGGEYVIIEDGIISDLSNDPQCMSGPHRALKEFLGSHAGQYDIDSAYADFFGYNYTWCTNGFLRKKQYALNPRVDNAMIRDFHCDDPAPRGIDSQMSPNERFQLYSAVRSLPRPRQGALRFVEIGSYAGASLMLMTQALRRLGVPIQGYAVEPGGTATFPQVISQLSDTVQHLKMFSYEAIGQLKTTFARDGNLPQLVFVDGDHSYEGVKKDIELYHEVVAPGGLMIFHDYLPPLSEQNRTQILFHHAGNEPGIRRACEDVIERQLKWPVVDLPLLYPEDPTQTQPHLPVIPGVYSTLRAYRKPLHSS